VTTRGTKIALGATGAITVRIAGTPGSGPFRVAARDVASTFRGAPAPLLDLVQPTGTFELGDTITIATTVTAKDANLGNAEAFEIDTTPIGGGPTTTFYGIVGQ
jgi:hypothetical protein